MFHRREWVHFAFRDEEKKRAGPRAGTRMFSFKFSSHFWHAAFVSFAGMEFLSFFRLMVLIASTGFDLYVTAALGGRALIFQDRRHVSRDIMDTGVLRFSVHI